MSSGTSAEGTDFDEQQTRVSRSAAKSKSANRTAPKRTATKAKTSVKKSTKGGKNLKSGLPKGSAVPYQKGKSCGRGKHNYVTAKSGKYAVCIKCHSRRSFPAEKPAAKGGKSK